MDLYLYFIIFCTFLEKLRTQSAFDFVTGFRLSVEQFVQKKKKNS